ncbi:MAG TPA: ABC transporter permease [Polyangiaceae bacterium]|nr:ABC transporter permease [Polyangiaceae bacterium]
MSLQSSLEDAGLARARRADALVAERPARLPGSPSASLGESRARAWQTWVDLRELGWRFGAISLFLAAWEVAPRAGLISAAFVPPFSKALGALLRGLFVGELGRHVLVSLGRSLTGFVLALIVALPFGFLLGWFRKFESYLDPLIQVFRQTSAFALFPLFILVFGVGEISKVAIIFYGAQWYVLLNTISGVKEVDPLLIKLARSLRLSHFELFRKIILPAALPTIFTGLRLSATLSILLIVSAEMMGASEGLGLVLITAQYNFDALQMYAAIMLLASIGYATNYLLVALETRLTGWKPETTRY